jgi:hypothetical protein
MPVIPPTNPLLTMFAQTYRTSTSHQLAALKRLLLLSRGVQCDQGFA